MRYFIVVPLAPNRSELTYLSIYSSRASILEIENKNAFDIIKTENSS